MQDLTPREIVAELDKHIVGQADAKRAVAIALRNRWRWKQLPEDLRREIIPKNIMMIGPTGVGKTEITRRLARLTGAPFVKVEATKYTEVGYYGRDVESMIRDLVEAAISLVQVSKREEVLERAKEKVEERLLKLLLPEPELEIDPDRREEQRERYERNREKFKQKLLGGELEESLVTITVEQRNSPVQVFSNMGADQMDMDLQGMLDKMMPKPASSREIPVSDARRVLLDQEVEQMLDRDAINEEAIRLAEETGMVFLDEIDKVCGSEGEGSRGGDVSRQGVQRDLLPIVEGTNVQTKYGTINTEKILFVAAGAFHRSKPSDLMPELQGRFPIRVELHDLTRDDFIRILTEPASSLTRQYQELLRMDGVELTFTSEGIDRLADFAFQVNQTTQNIGARRLHTILERLLEEISFQAPSAELKKVTIDVEYVELQLKAISQDEDLNKFIL
ncbi:MAG: ATP-dependent protease ATPase subunit HslU [Planctomycetaceae bacterium]|jgi:ATP-dependent HslUV protease ATP-binding subunit HslU|nr:ATP-dependent protease ATPase subunit HslU [Planctomycetaceae bacterium]